MKCKKCGTEIINGNTFCTNCGEKIVEEKEPITIQFGVAVTGIIIIPILISLIIFLIYNNGNVKQIFDDTIESSEKSDVINNQVGEVEKLTENLNGEKSEQVTLPTEETTDSELINPEQLMGEKSNKATTNETDGKKQIVPSSLMYKTEQEAISILDSKEIPYTIDHQEKLSYKDKTIYNVEIASNRKLYTSSYILFEDGESLVLYVSKYNNRTVDFDIDVASFIYEYVNSQGASADTNQFVFDLKIDGKSTYSETISNSKAKSILKTTRDITEIVDYRDDFGSDHTKLKTNYTTYGVFNLTFSVNGVAMQEAKCDMYKTDYSENGQFIGHLNISREKCLITIYSNFGYGGSG